MPQRLLAYFSVTGWKTRLVFWSGAIAVGAVAALFAIAASWISDLHDLILTHSRWWSLLIAPVGLIAVSWLTRRVFPGAQGSGIPQAVAALQTGSHELRRRVLSVRIAFGKIFLTLLGLLSGASIGREGPTVHIGASVMFSLGRRAKFPHHYLEHGLILAGGAAGIAAAFNTPIAGIMFAIEEMARTFEEKSSGTLLTAVIIAGVVAVGAQGNYTYFGTTSTFLPSGEAWIAVPVCGLIGGVLGGIFSHALVLGTRRIAPHLRSHPILVAAACGLVIAGLGLLSHGNSYGAGYIEAKHLLTGDAPPAPFFPLYKILATIVSYLSGIPGGIFSPSLAAGAGIGADLAPFIPAAPVAAVVILGMVAYFTGVVQTPITGAWIVVEMANDHGMILPIMATAFIAFGASKLICRTPIYWALAEEFLAQPEQAQPVTAADLSAGTAPAGDSVTGS